MLIKPPATILDNFIEPADAISEPPLVNPANDFLSESPERAEWTQTTNCHTFNVLQGFARRVFLRRLVGTGRAKATAKRVYLDHWDSGTLGA